MTQNLTISIVQTSLYWEDISKNITHFEHLLQNIKHSDIIVLPEMFTTGFSMTPESCYETIDGKTVNWMKKMAKKKQAAITGSIIIKENNKFYNRLIWAKSNGNVEFYNKRHLFSLMQEEKVYTAGTKKLIVECNGWKICPLICYDLRFPVWSRNTEQYDVLIYVANWPKIRIFAWDNLLIARAIENQAYTVGVNRIGFDNQNIEFSGNSAIYNPLGEKISTCKDNTETVETIKLNKNELLQIRKKFQFLNDIDPFSLNS